MSTAGVTFLDHTADVGFDLRAPSPPALFHAAALAALALLRGHEDVADLAGPGDGPRPVRRSLDLAAPDPPRLLAEWLRELLFLHEVDRLDYEGADFERLDLTTPCRLRARLVLRPGGEAVREIKGVTYHEIDARPVGDGWAARVIFDV